MNRREFNLISMGLLSLTSIGSTDQPAPEPAEKADLYENFLDPNRSYTVQPMWFWNDKLDPAEIARQLEEMSKQGVYGVYMMPVDGMTTPYLSEEYFRGIGAALQAARRLGMQFNFNDEYSWPSGEAWDMWGDSPVLSRVVRANPEFHRKTLRFEEFDFNGPIAVSIPLAYTIELAVACQMEGHLVVKQDSLRLLPDLSKKNQLNWDVPPGRWRVVAYRVEDMVGWDASSVDLMNPDAVRKFVEIVYESYYSRFADYFGTTIQAARAASESSYGPGLAWTPRLLGEFEKRKQYGIQKYLPLLMYDGGKLTDKVRCDFLDVVGQIYSEAIGGVVTQWAESHGLKHSGSFWYESLLIDALHQGDFFQLYRAFSLPQVDALMQSGRVPVFIKHAVSIAHFKGTKMENENQALQGLMSYISPEKMRLGTNMIANWGVSIYVPPFSLSSKKAWWPPIWFTGQPFWPYFHHYADYVRRISYMNTDGQHVAPVVIFNNIESVWANSSPLFDPRQLPGGGFAFGNFADEAERAWEKLQIELSSAGWDFDMMDHYYLNEAKIDAGQLRLANESYPVLVLPPMQTVRRASLEKMVRFFEAGGMILAVERLPNNSMDEGRDDPQVAALVTRLFGTLSPKPGQIRTSRSGGKAVFVRNIRDLFPLLDQFLVKDGRVVRGDPDHFFCLHRRKLGQDFYWVVNDSEHVREMTVRFSAVGVPEKWDAETGEKSPLFYTTRKDSTLVRLPFHPWDAYYVVFSPPAAGREQEVELVATNLKELQIVSRQSGQIVVAGVVPAWQKENHVTLAWGGQKYRGEQKPSPVLEPIVLSGTWRISPQSKTVRVAYAKAKMDRDNVGQSLGWAGCDYRDDFWSDAWLAAERFTARRWWALGPFPNHLHEGFWEVYPPEKGVDLKATYQGARGPIHWRELVSSTPGIAMDSLLGTERDTWVVGYAFTYFHSPTTRKVQVHANAPNLRVFLNGKQILAHHYFPWYWDLRDSRCEPVEVTLEAGWNTVLVKVEKDRIGYSPSPNFSSHPGMGFYFRFTDERGNNIPEIICNHRKTLELPPRTDGLGVAPLPIPSFGPEKEAAPVLRGATPPKVWYRVAVPPGVTAVHLPPLAHPYNAHFNGVRVHPDTEGKLALTGLQADARDVLALRVDYSDEIPDYMVFDSGSSDFNLMSLTLTGLQNYSGLVDYEKDFELPAHYAGNRLELHLGQVGVTAEVWLNGQRVGERVWRPFAFDITSVTRAGRNNLRVRVANSDSNQRWEAGWRQLLQGKLDLNGLMGPVQVFPKKQISIVCRPQGSGS